MRKLTLLIISLFVTLGTMAQINVNTSAYTVKSVNRGFLYYDANNAGSVTSSSHTSLVDATPTGLTNEQFAFLRTDNTPADQYYMYSIGASQFVTYRDNNSVKLELTDEPACTWVLEASGTYYGIKVPGTDRTYINITNWQAVNGCKVIGTGLDEGNKMTLTEVATGLDLTAAIRKIKILENDSPNTLSEFDPNTLYTVTTPSRGGWAVAEGNFTSANGDALNWEDTKQQFAVLEKDGNYYLYSVAENKFVRKDKKLAAGRGDAIELIDASAQGTNRVVVKFKGDEMYINLDNYSNLLIDGWNTIDEGNAVVFLYAGEFDSADAIEMIDSYAHNTNSINRNDRRLNSFTITDGERNLAVSSIQTSNTSPVYVDKTDNVLKTVPGATLSFSAFSYNGTWMHAYAYIDYNKDYRFNLTNNNDGTGNGEIVSYNYFDGNNILGVSVPRGNAIAYPYGENNTGISKGMPEFTLPANLPNGEYRMRVKVDWNNIDADFGASDIAGNGGCQCDITIKVTNEFAKAELGALVEQLNAYSLGDAIGLYSSSAYSHDDLNGIKNNASNFYNGIDDNTPVADIQGYISTLNTVLPTISLNVPAAGKHYRLKNAVSGNYMSAKSDNSVKMLKNGAAALSTIFFLGENNTLYSYTQEKYLDCQGKNLIAEAKAGEFGPAYSTPTENVVTYKNNSYWTFGNRADGVSIDRGKPDVNADGYNWIFEEVKTLPVAAIGDTGYTTLEDAKDAALATTDAVVIVLLAETDATIVFPANVTINKNGFTAENLAVAVAKIGDTLYATLAKAVDAAQAGQTVVLLKDTEETLVLPAGVKLDKSNVTAPNVNEAAAKIGDVLYATLAEAANIATKGQTVTILRSTDETAVFAYGVVIEKAEGVVAPNATNEVAVDVPANVVGDIVNNSGVETETVNGVVGALQNNEAVISNTPTNLPVGAKLVVTLVNIIFESEAPAKVVYDVTPKNGDAEVEPTEEITFRLPVPANWKYAKVYHEGIALEGIYPVQEGNYVEVASQDFSEFAVEIAEPVAKIGDVDYYTFEAALDAAQANETITLVADVTCAEKPVFNNGGVVNVDINGHILVSNEQGRIRNVASADGTVASNNIKFVSGFGWEVYSGNDVEGANFRVFPTLNEAVAYIPASDRVARIYLYENIKLENDITLRKYYGGTSSTICVEPGYEITLDLNGYTVLQESPTGNPLEACIRGKFTLDDTSDAKTGKWIAGACGVTDTSNEDWYGGGGPAFYVLGDGELILAGGTVSIARNASMNSDGDPVVNEGGLIRLDSGSLTVDGATLQCDDTFGVMAWGGNVVVNSGKFVMGENGAYSVFASKYYADASVEVNTAIDGYLHISSNATATVNAAGVKYVADGTNTKAPAVGEGLVAQGGVVGYPVAKIGEDGYLTLEAAVAATEAATITMLADVELTESLVIAEGKTITLNLNGKTVDVAWENEEDGKHIYALTNNGTLTVTGDGTINTRGIYNYGDMTLTSGTINAIDGNGGYGVRNYPGATFTMDGGTIATTLEDDNKVDEGGYDATPVRVDEGATFTMNGGVINNICDFTVAIDNHGTTIIEGGEATTVHTTLANSGTMTINGGEFTCNGIEGITAHALWAAAGETTINGGTFNGKDNYNGFNVDAEEGAVVNITGGTFLAVHSGSLYGNGTITVSGGTFFDAVPANRCAEGFVCEANGDGTYGVQFASYIVLPEGVNSSNYAELFGDNTVTDGTNYYATLQAAVEAVAGQANAVLYCKPGADVGSLQHAPVTSTLTVYGNGADVTGGAERDFDLSNTDPSFGNDITADMTLTVKHLNGCGAWGAKATEHTVNLVFENCANMGKVFITGTTGTLNITMTDCAFEGVINEAVYSNADGAITLTNVAFSNLNKAVNLNHKAAGTQTVTIDGCTFTNCGADVAADQIPVRVLSSVEGGKSVLTVTGSTFTGTPEGGADILLDYGVGLTTASVSGTAANVVVEKEHNVGTTTAVKADETVEFTTALPVAQVGETKYMTLAEAVADATEGATITLLRDVETTDGIVITDKNLVIDLNSKTYTTTEGASTNNRNFKIEGTSVVTIKNGTMVAAGDYSSGAYGTVRTEGSANVTLEGLKLYNYRGNGLNIKACAGTTVTVKDTEIYANYGGGIESAGGTIVVDNVTVEQKGMYISPYNSMAISVNGGGKVTVNSGTYSTECITAEEANNQGTSHGPWVAGVLNSGGTLIINGGTFSNDNFGENSLATYARGAILADTKAKVEINGGKFNVLKNVIDIQNNLGDANNNPSVVLAGGTYNADPRISAQYGSNLIILADGYAALPDLNGNYVVGVKPTATVNNLGMTTVKAGDYSIWNGSFDQNTEDDGDMPLSFVMQFLADQDAEDMETSPFADWYGDFVITFTGIENGSFTADGCYLAGHYGSFGWVKVPVDGMEIEEGARYPVMLGVGMGQKYNYICSSVEDFKCALYLTPEILEANPNIQVKLELAVVDNSKGSDAAASALVSNDKVYNVTEYTYNADDFEKVELPEVVITDIKGSLTDSDPDLTFALNFAIKDVENLDPEYLEKLFAQYGDWYTDYVLTISGLTDDDVTFNANGNADGYLSGQYDAWSTSWVSVPFEDVTLANGASIYIMEYAAKLMGKPGLRFTLAEVAEIVQNFDCGVYFTPEFLDANPNMKVDLHLKVFTEDAEGNKVNDINVATNNFDIEDYVAIVHADDKQTQYCTTLAGAVAAAADGATITMLRDVVLTEAVKVVGKAITLDLNGKTVSGTCNSNQGYLVYIENNAALTVVDNSDAKDGKLTYAKGTSNVGWTVDVKGAFTLEAGTVELTGDDWSIGYAVDVRPNSWGTEYTNPSVFTMNGGKLVSSDGAVRVASSSADQYANVSASFEMNGGEIDAAWDGVFIQQSNTAYDVLNFTINNGTIKGGLNPVRVYGPAPTSYVNGQECMSINFNGGTMTYTGTETREWVIDGVLRVGGGSSIETIVENGNITASETFAQAQALPDGYIWEQDGETYKVVEAPKAPEVVDGKIEFVDGEFDMYTNDTDIENVEITYKRTIDSDWNALYVPFAIPASELLADFDIAYINDVRETDEDDDGELDSWQMELIKIKNETAVLRANHPYFVRSKSADYTENNLSLTLTTTLYKATVAEFECSSVYSTYTVKGLNELRASTEFGDADRVLGYDNGETTWGKMADGYSLKPFRFYLTITNHDGSPVLSSSAQMSIVVRDEDGTTGINGIYGDENGETVIFDLYGRRVLEPEKGNIYIINGKKVLVK